MYQASRHLTQSADGGDVFTSWILTVGPTTFVQISHRACEISHSCNLKRVVSSLRLCFIQLHFRPSILSCFHPPHPACFPGPSILQQRDYSKNPEKCSVFWWKPHRSRSQIKGIFFKGNPVLFTSRLRSTVTFDKVRKLQKLI